MRNDDQRSSGEAGFYLIILDVVILLSMIFLFKILQKHTNYSAKMACLMSLMENK